MTIVYVCLKPVRQRGDHGSVSDDALLLQNRRGRSGQGPAACGALILLVGVTFFGVIMRYCLGDPFVWQEEVQLALIIWVVFLGGRYAFVCGNHAAIDVIVEMFPEKLQKLLSVLIAAAAVIIPISNSLGSKVRMTKPPKYALLHN